MIERITLILLFTTFSLTIYVDGQDETIIEESAVVEDVPVIIDPDDMHTSLDRIIKIAMSGDRERAKELLNECFIVFGEEAIFYYDSGVISEYRRRGKIRWRPEWRHIIL